MKATDIDRLLFSPFHTSKILHHFLSGAKSVNRDTIKTELIFLVIPFIYNDIITGKLKNLKISSKFNAFIESEELDLFKSSINESIKDYKKITNTAIIILANQIELSLNKFVSISEEIHYSSEKDEYLKAIYKASYNLGVILGKERYLTVFKKLDIIEL